MSIDIKDMYINNLGISSEVYDYSEKIITELEERFKEIDKIAEYNQLKVLSAMQKNRVSEMHLNGSSGYGYNDDGRDTLEQIYADIFKTEAALVRPQIMCGTHALNVALAGNLRPGDELLSPVGKPYDTMDEIIGIRPSKGSLSEYGVTYRQVDLLSDGSFDYENIAKAINDKTKLVTIQRSKGYAQRPTLSVKKIGELIKFIKNIKPDVICMVDNCYGEFVELTEPSDVGADMVVGSLIKNPGRPCPMRRIYCRHKRMYRAGCLQTFISWAGKRGWCHTRCQQKLLSGAFPCAYRSCRCCKRSCICS